MNRYIRLTFDEREEISRQLAQGAKIRAIARALRRSPSTISREVNRNVVHLKFYRAIYAQQRARKYQHKPQDKRKLDINPKLKEFVMLNLKKKWSPEQIANRLKFLYPRDMNMRISHESIYQYLYVLPRGELKNEFTRCLRRKHKNRLKNKIDRRNNGPVQECLSIEERPTEVNNRIIPGHWEGDLLIGGTYKTGIGVLLERTTRMTFLVPLENKYARTVRNAFANVFKKLPHGLVKTLTYDRGPEMSEHRLFTKSTKIKVYFTNPRSPWEKGSVENTNSLLRQYFPKNTDFTKVSKIRLKEIQDELNDRPRKALDWQTPHEKFIELLH